LVTSNNEQAQARLAELEREIVNIMNAIKQGIITSTTKVMLMQAERPSAKVCDRRCRGQPTRATSSRWSYPT